MHALPLAAPDLSAALPATVPAAAGAAPDDRFSAHLWAASGVRPGQPAQNAVPARDAEGAAPGDPEALAPDGDAPPVFSEDQDAAGAATAFDPANLVAGLIAGWLPWQANAGAQSAAFAAGRAAESTGAAMDAGSAMGRLLAAIVTRGHSGPIVSSSGPMAAQAEPSPVKATAQPAHMAAARPATAGITPAAAGETGSTATAGGSRSTAAAPQPALTVVVPAAAAEADPQGAVRFLAAQDPAAAAAASQAPSQVAPSLSPTSTLPPAVQPAAGANLDAASPPPGSSTTVAPQTLTDPAAPRSDLAAGRQPESATPPGTAPQVLDPMVSELRLGRTASLVPATPTVDDPTGPTAAATPLSGTGQQVRQDAADLAIRSHLPAEAPANVRGEAGRQDPTNSGAEQDNTPTDAGARQAATVQPLPGTGQEEPPAPFGLRPEIASATNATATGADPAVQRLPSGLIVPDTAVMDQVLAHLSLQRRLASTTVHLRLNPQELGELRMEIKVEQDNIKAHIIAQNPQAQEMIDRHLPRLREALEQQGLHLQQVSVTLAGGDHADSQRFHDNFNRHPASGGPQGVSTPLPFAPSATATAQPATAPAGGVNVVA